MKNEKEEREEKDVNIKRFNILCKDKRENEFLITGLF